MSGVFKDNEYGEFLKMMGVLFEGMVTKLIYPPTFRCQHDLMTWLAAYTSILLCVCVCVCVCFSAVTSRSFKDLVGLPLRSHRDLLWLLASKDKNRGGLRE